MTADPSTRGEPTGTSITDADPRPHVVVLGAGFAGLAAVRALRKAPVRVTLVDRHSYSTFQPLLYQVATGALNPGDITYGARGFAAHTGARFRKGAVLTIDPDTRTISLDVGPDLHYDYLVIANGVTTNYFGVPGAAENAYPIYTRAEALAVRDRMTGYLDQIAATGERRGASVVVVGGGATGVEMAGTLAELRNTVLPDRYPELDPSEVNVVLVEMTDRVLPPFAKRLRDYAAAQLRARGVELRLEAAVKEVRPDSVLLADGTELEAQMTVWATGVSAHERVKSWGLRQGKGGRIVVGGDLRVPEHPEILVAGRHRRHRGRPAAPARAAGAPERRARGPHDRPAPGGRAHRAVPLQGQGHDGDDRARLGRGRHRPRAQARRRARVADLDVRARLRATG